jgi:hypothetical protein
VWLYVLNQNLLRLLRLDPKRSVKHNLRA